MQHSLTSVSHPKPQTSEKKVSISNNTPSSSITATSTSSSSTSSHSSLNSSSSPTLTITSSSSLSSNVAVSSVNKTVELMIGPSREEDEFLRSQPLLKSQFEEIVKMSGLPISFHIEETPNQLLTCGLFANLDSDLLRKAIDSVERVLGNSSISYRQEEDRNEDLAFPTEEEEETLEKELKASLEDEYIKVKEQHDKMMATQKEKNNGKREREEKKEEKYNTVEKKISK